MKRKDKFSGNWINEKKKGESSLISIVLLIGFTIILGAVIFSYSNFEVNKQISEFSKLKESTKLINLKIKDVKVENFNKVNILLENNGGIDLDNVLVRINGDKGVSTIKEEGVKAYSTKLITEDINYDKIGNIKSIETIPYSIEKSAVYSLSKDTTLKIEQVITNDICKNDKDNDQIPDCVDNCVDEQCKTNENCRLIDAKWSTDSVAGGMPVNLIINGENCNFNKVELKLIEVDTLTPDDIISNDFSKLPSNIEFKDDVASLNWNSVYIQDKDGNNPNPEYIVEAKLDDQVTYSNILEVVAPGIITLNPVIVPIKSDFKADEDALFIFEYISDDIYDILRYRDNQKGTMKNKWVSDNEAIDILVYDSNGILVNEDVKITKIRGGKFAIDITGTRGRKPGQ